MNHHQEFWNAFSTRMRISTQSVPLFDHTDDLVVQTKTVGKAVEHQRPVLKRSAAMEARVRTETDTLIADWESGSHAYDGLIYMMFLKNGDAVSPLYIGKTETLGKSAGNLSSNIKNLHANTSKFARWGGNYAYHIGDLSAVVLHGHSEKKVNRKYEDWAKALFVDFPTAAPRLKQPVYFWTTAWKKTGVGPWEGFGPTRLTFLEYLLIGVASSVFPELLLNREGQNRG